jgi:hypothetical protein
MCAVAQNTSEHQGSAELPTCLTLLRSLVVSRAAKLLGRRFLGSLANFLPPARRAGLFWACVPPVPGVRSGSKEVWEQKHEVGMSSARADGTEVRPKRRCMRS